MPTEIVPYEWDNDSMMGNEHGVWDLCCGDKIIGQIRMGCLVPGQRFEVYPTGFNIHPPYTTAFTLKEAKQVVERFHKVCNVKSRQPVIMYEPDGTVVDL